MELAATWDALLLVEDDVLPLAVPEAVPDPLAVADPEAAVPEAEAVPLVIAESAPGVGAPKVETPDGIGPTGADAEAPIPTKNPTPCYGK